MPSKPETSGPMTLESQELKLSRELDGSSVTIHQSILIIPCFNRRTVTLGCLRHLHSLGLFAQFGVIVVDDGSTDGTARAVGDEFPTVQILDGTGDLYWTGAIEWGMKVAFSQGASSVVWLNDDTVVAAGAIEAVVARAEEIGGVVTGQGEIVSETDYRSSFFPLNYRGCYDLKQIPVDLAKVEIPVDCCRGNLVAISRKVAESIGYPDGIRIPHAAGDTDYTLRASKAGFPVRVLTGARVKELCVVPPITQSWLLGTTPIVAHWRRIFQKQDGFYLPMVFVYHTRHWGITGTTFAVFLYAKLLVLSCLRILPLRLRLLFFSKFSKSLR